MRTTSKLVPIALFGGAVFAQACGDVTNESPGNEYAIAGVIRGSVSYTGPAPCSQNGHIVGNAIVLVFDRRNPPPPSGLANTAVNFGVIPGDALFADQPRNAGSNLACPASGTVQASGNYAISPMAAGSYVVQAFYDYTGNFLPTFKIRNLPEATDVGGGYFDITDATSDESFDDFEANGSSQLVTEQKAQDPNYQPVFLPVDVGTAGAVPAGSKVGVPEFTMPDTGYIADNVNLTIASKLTLPRPYFWPTAYTSLLSTGKPAQAAAQDGTQGFATTSPFTTYGNGDSSVLPTTSASTPANLSGDPNFQPILTFPASLQVFAPPNPATILSSGNVDLANEFQGSFPQIQLNAGLPAAEVTTAEDPAQPFHYQLDPQHYGQSGIFVWWNNPPGSTSATNLIPEGNQVRRLWPLVVLAKLVDPLTDPSHPSDPQSIISQGADLLQPVVIIQGITIQQNSLLATANGVNCTAGDATCFTLGGAFGATKIENLPDPATNLQSKVTVLIRPSAVCIDPNHIDQGGVLVTPHLTGSYPPGDTTDPGTPGKTPVVPAGLQDNPQLSTLVNSIQEACIPDGRYAINVVYPTGQAWTAPNESGSCASLEGNAITTSDPGSCSLQVRPVLTSQGTRAVVEVTPDPTYCVGAHAVPAACTTVNP